MTDQYARVAKPSSSLDKRLCAFSRRDPALTRGSACRYADAMARRDLIAEKLTKAFAPASLDVVDESHQHVGHAGHREGGETHFRVYIVAEAFRGKSRLERHRMINETLVGELAGGVHALAIHASAPGESGA
jgi:BolA protein